MTISVQTTFHVIAGSLARGLQILDFMTSLITYCEHLKLVYTSPQGPCDVTHITLTDKPTRCTGCKFTKIL